jgi:hypothetical protein
MFWNFEQLEAEIMADGGHPCPSLQSQLAQRKPSALHKSKSVEALSVSVAPQQRPIQTPRVERPVERRQTGELEFNDAKRLLLGHLARVRQKLEVSRMSQREVSRRVALLDLFEARLDQHLKGALGQNMPIAVRKRNVQALIDKIANIANNPGG